LHCTGTGRQLVRRRSAVLTAKRASVCDTDTTAFNPSTLALGNFTYSWTMIANTAGGSWLQSGYFRSYGTSMFHFAQYKPLGGGVYDVFGDVVPTGEVHHYWQQYLPDSSGAFHSNVDSTRFINATPSGWSGYSGQYFNETRYHSSDVPGTAASPAPFSNVQIEGSTAIWSAVPTSYLTPVNHNPSRWGVSGTTAFSIWTN
jgi:hypothetical protein